MLYDRLMKIQKKALFILAYILISAACPDPKQEHATLDCSGSGKWEYGSKTLGPVDDPKHPFISGPVPGTCASPRPELIQKIKKKLTESVPQSANKVAIFTMGPPGAGKSTAINRVLGDLRIADADIIKINPDDLRSKLPDYITKTTLASPVCPSKYRAYAEAAGWCLAQGREIRSKILPSILRGGKSFLYDSHCADWQYCQRLIHSAQKKGFKTYLIGVYAPLATCQARSDSRALQTGRYVPHSIISKAYNDIKGNFKTVADAAIKDGGRAYIFDNSGTEPSLSFTINKSSDVCDTTAEPSCSYFLKQPR